LTFPQATERDCHGACACAQDARNIDGGQTRLLAQQPDDLHLPEMLAKLRRQQHIGDADLV
jgi:hypothetical protein